MPASYAPKTQLNNILYDVLMGDQHSYTLQCDDNADALRLRMRLNKLRQGDRRERERDHIKAGRNPKAFDYLSEFDKLVFRVEASRLIIEKQDQPHEDLRLRLHPTGSPAPLRPEASPEETKLLNPRPATEIFEV